MLPSKHHIHYPRKNKIHPAKLPHNQNSIDSIQEILDIISEYFGQKRSEVEEALSFFQSQLNPRYIKGIVALIFKEAVFQSAIEEDALQLRERSFDQSVIYWQKKQTGELHPLEHQKNITKQIFGGEDKVSMMEQVLFQDLQMNQILIKLNRVDPEYYLNEFNISQIQGVLFNAIDISISLKNCSKAMLKKIIQHLKFFQIFFFLEVVDKKSIRLTLDSVGSILENRTSYGIHFCRFIRALCCFNIEWELYANIKIKNNPKSFEFQYQNKILLQEKVKIEHRFSELIELTSTKYPQYQIKLIDQFIKINSTEYAFPDIEIVIQEFDKKFMIEVFIFFNLTKLKNLEKFIKQVPQNYLIAMKGKLSKIESLKEETKERIILFNTDLTPSLIHKKIKNLLAL